MSVVLAAIAARRTVKQFTGAPIPRETVESLVQHACLAPNHRLSQTWRFVAADQAAIARLCGVLGQSPIADTVRPDKLPRILAMLGRCGALVQVTCVRHPDPAIHAEDRDASAAAVQNLLLAAHDLDLGSFWSTSPLLAHPEALRWFGADPAAEVHLGTVLLGIPEGDLPPAPPRRAMEAVFRWA